MTNHPRLIPTSVPPRPTAAVLVLHGGAGRREDTVVSPTQLSVLRMRPVARAVADAGRRRLAVFRLLNSARGWDPQQTPVADVTWALGEVREMFGGDLPVGLVGHSLGGRAALLAADQPAVRTAVALNPWVQETDGRGLDLSGRAVLIVHGDQDRIASPRRSAAITEDLRRTTDVGYVVVGGGKHAMLRRGRVFERIAGNFLAATLLGDPAHPPVSQVLGGERLVEV